MNGILLAACMAMVTSVFTLFNISPQKMTDDILLFLARDPKSIKSQLGHPGHGRKKPFLKRELDRMADILKSSGKEGELPRYFAISLLMSAAGMGLALMLGNLFLVPVMAAGMLMLPFWYVKLTQYHYKKAVSSELETALSIITGAYIRSEDIRTAIEENIKYINPPLQSVFAGFTSRIRLLDPDITAAIADMREKVDDDVFRQWCDGLASCQFDRNMKSILLPIAGKLSDMRIVNGELENMVFEPRKEFIVMAALVLGNVPLMYFLNDRWYEILMHTVPGQLILALCAAAVFVSAAFVIRLTRPVTYRR